MNKLRNNFVWSGLFPIVVLGSSNMFLWILKDNPLKGIVIYAITLLLSFALLSAIHLKLFGDELLEEYQWGNEDFEKFEDIMLDKFYLKGIVDDDTFYDYFDDNDREHEDEDYYLYEEYVKRGRLLKWMLSLLIACGSCVPTLLTIA